MERKAMISLGGMDGLVTTGGVKGKAVGRKVWAGVEGGGEGVK